MADDPLTPAARDAAMTDNGLLAAFPAAWRERLRDELEIVRLDAGERVVRRGSDIPYTVFPLGAAMISGVIDLADGRSVEVTSVGREGAVGGVISTGQGPAFVRAEVVVPGAAARVPVRIIDLAKAGSAEVRTLFSRYSDYLLAHIMQSVACNSFHSIEQRAARWLLTAHDRGGDRLALTQEALAGLLGVQRTTVNAVARLFAEEGLISTRRGTITVHDRAALEARACECHDRVESFFGDIIGTDKRAPD
jgi:CRP-like cAMP-binding protein